MPSPTRWSARRCSASSPNSRDGEAYNARKACSTARRRRAPPLRGAPPHRRRTEFHPQPGAELVERGRDRSAVPGARRPSRRDVRTCACAAAQRLDADALVEC
jgi:hypothetical protein